MNLRKLYEHLDRDARRVLHSTADTAARDGRRGISIELFLLSLLRDRFVGPTVMQALEGAGMDAPAVESALAAEVSKEKRVADGALPSFSGSLAQLLREAWSLSFDDYGESQVTPVRFFETIARHGDQWPQLVDSLPGMASLDLAALAVAGRAGGAEAAAAAAAAATGTGGAAAAAPVSSDTTYPELSRYGRDLVAAARAGEFDPVVGLQTEMQAISSILLRRRQNSVAVVGESGVGKSACATGFVDALARGLDAVPAVLRDTPVWSLDVSALRAGAVVRGALEERLQAIVKEVRDAGMILFVDDIHLLFGDQSGGADALRSVLSDGAVRILATCGWREWRRYVEPDAGLARRVAAVRISEPGDAEALRILAGLAPGLAEHHSVTYGENVLDSAVSLARRYIVGRQLPDKAIVVLDSACARARMEDATSGATSGATSETTSSDATETDTSASADIATGDSTAGSAEKSGSGEKAGNAGNAESAEQSENEAAPTVVVEEEHVASVVSDLTGVPIGGMLSDVSKMAARLEDILGERVMGQEEAMERCASQARAYLAGLSDRRRPVGALMFCGPSGVGKTETAHAIADALFGGRLLTINMSEYQEAHTVSGLKGAPAGYVGYGEGGVLTEGIRRTPYCVVLLDEIEKAHGDVIEMLYQVLDRGWMEDAEGLEADFSNALIILTSNAGGGVIEKAAAAEEAPAEDVLHQALTRSLTEHFPAAFIGRLQLVPFWPLGHDTLGQIAGMRLDRLSDAYKGSHRATLEFADDVRAWLVDHVKSTPQGARFLDGVVARAIRPAVAEYVLDRLGNELPPVDAIVRMDHGEFVVRESGAGEAPEVSGVDAQAAGA